MNELVRHLVSYVVQRVREEGGTTEKTKLVKLLYLIDVEHYQGFRETLTGLDWRFHHFGPYAFEIEPLLQSMPPDFEEERFTSATGRTGYSYRGDADLNALEDDLDSRVGSPKRRVVDRVVKEWALDGLNAILDYVYFDTEPMEDAHRGDKLDFTTIPARGLQVPQVPRPTVPSEELKALRRRYKEMLAARGRARPRRFEFPPYDDVYFEALKTMEAREGR